MGCKQNYLESKHLREKLSNNKFNLEHVTPRYKKSIYQKKIKFKSLKNLSNFKIKLIILSMISKELKNFFIF